MTQETQNLLLSELEKRKAAHENTKKKYYDNDMIMSYSDGGIEATQHAINLVKSITTSKPVK